MLIGTRQAPIIKKGVQLPPAVSIGTKQMLSMVPRVAAAPPRPESEPTLLPEWKSEARVWMLFIVNWKPKRMTAIHRTATTGPSTNAT